MTLEETQSPVPSWGLDRIDQNNLPLSGSYTYQTSGVGVHAYIIDTGIRDTHSEFSGRIGNGVDFIDGGSPNDCDSHGTHVAGTVGGSTVGVAKNVIVHAVRVLNCSGTGAVSGIIAGINWVINNKIQPSVVNMSLSAANSNALNSAVDQAVAGGTVVVVAASNNSSDACLRSPASASSVLTVGATTSSDFRASYSNFGNCVDVFAPGSSIYSATIGDDNHYGFKNGTSMASPHVAGVVARYLEFYPSATPSEITDVLKENALENIVQNSLTSPNLFISANFADISPEEEPVTITPVLYLLLEQ